jgi:hypothetical protein
MSRLNKVVMRQFTDALDNSAFTLSDFQVTFPDQGKVFAAATFTPNPQYTFKLVPDGTDVITEETPGDSFWTQRVSQYGMPSAIARVETWTKNIRADIRAATPLFDEFEELREELKTKITEHEADLKGHFTREEAAVFDAKFDEILARFEELRKKNEITEAQLNEIKRDLSALKENAKTFEKQAFFKTAGNKLINICRRVGGSKVARTIGLEAAKEVTKLALEGKLQLPRH